MHQLYTVACLDQLGGVVRSMHSKHGCSVQEQRSARLASWQGRPMLVWVQVEKGQGLQYVVVMKEEPLLPLSKPQSINI